MATPVCIGAGDDHVTKAATAIHENAEIRVRVEAVARRIDDILEIKKDGDVLRFGALVTLRPWIACNGARRHRVG